MVMLLEHAVRRSTLQNLHIVVASYPKMSRTTDCNIFDIPVVCYNIAVCTTH